MFGVLGLIVLAHLGGYYAYKHLHGFAEAPTTWAAQLVQVFALAGLLVYSIAKGAVREVPWANWRIEALKAVLASEIALALCCWGLLWVPAEVSADAGFRLMMGGWVASTIALTVLVVLRYHHRAVRARTNLGTFPG